MLGHPFDVAIVVVEAIARGPTGKFEEFLSLLPAETPGPAMANREQEASGRPQAA